jgi:hypothetical protein
MKINEYVKKWYDEDYDIRQEEFYVKNASWVAEREWSSGGIKHGIFAGIVAITLLAESANNLPSAILNSMLALAILTVCFCFYAMREYDESDWAGSKATYVLVLIFLLITKGKVGLPVQWIFAILGTMLYFYTTFYRPIKMRKIKKEMEQKIKEMEEEEERANKDSYSKWEEEYKAFRYGLPESDIPDGDPKLEEARNLFKGYDSTKDMLKTRYRHLAKQYHPDNGGDEYMFQCIIEVYEELCQQFT